MRTDYFMLRKKFDLLLRVLFLVGLNPPDSIVHALKFFSQKKSLKICKVITCPPLDKGGKSELINLYLQLILSIKHSLQIKPYDECYRLLGFCSMLHVTCSMSSPLPQKSKRFKLSRMKDEFKAQIEEADRLKFEGRHHDAIQICESILAEDPSCIEAYEEIGDNYISLNQLERAERALLKAIELDAKSANAAYLLGFLYSCRRDWENSIEFLEKADDLKPNHQEILRCLGWSYAMQGDRQKGIILLERAKALAPDDAFVLTDLGVCYLNEKQIEKALPIFRKVLDIDPDNERARECLIIVEEYAAGASRMRRT